jgi:hypothetical protein
VNEYQIQTQSTAAEIRAQANLIQQVMQAVMKSGTHYGTVPGCGDKPTLLKAGAEKILSTFHISAEPEVEDLSTSDESRYRVLTKGVHRESGMVVGVGVGECSSNEEKYKWRASICDEEWNETPEDRRRSKWKKGYNGQPNYQVKQIRTEIADVANTVLKMAKKRSMVDLTLTATAASDIFTQDVEDMPSEYFERQEQPRNGKPPIQSTTSKKVLSEAQVKRFIAISKNSGATDDIVKIILDNEVPDNIAESGKFDWNKVSKQQYDTLCNMFESGEWKAKFEQLTNDEKAS